MNEKWEPVEFRDLKKEDVFTFTQDNWEDDAPVYKWFGWMENGFLVASIEGTCQEVAVLNGKAQEYRRKVKEKQMNEKLEKIIAAVIEEFKEATSKFKSYNSAHEGYAVIHEELDELWDEVKKKKKSKERMREEAIQVAVTAIRFVHDVIGETEE